MIYIDNKWFDEIFIDVYILKNFDYFIFGDFRFYSFNIMLLDVFKCIILTRILNLGRLRKTIINILS